MSYRNVFKAYQRQSLNTSDPVKIVVMLYEGAVRNLRLAAEHFEQGRREEGSERIARTLDIIRYLNGVLDHNRGGEVSTNLTRLYEYVRDLLAEANIHGDVERIRTAIEVLTPLLEGWQGITQRSTADTHSDVAEAPEEQPGISMMG